MAQDEMSNKKMNTEGWIFVDKREVMMLYYTNSLNNFFNKLTPTYNRRGIAAINASNVTPRYALMRLPQLNL